MVFPDPCGPAGSPRPVLVDAPSVTPYGYGAITAFSVIDDPDEHQRFGIVYKSLVCDAGVLPLADECGSVPFNKVPTNHNTDTIVRGCPFHLYSAIDCKTTTLEAMQAEVEYIFDLNEQRAVEGQVWNNLIAQLDVIVLNASSLPADALGIEAGIATLESHIASCYPGVATIHADRGLASYLAIRMLIEKQGGAAFTNLGTRLAFYSGAPNTGPDGSAAPAGHAWLYATSQVTLRRFTKISPEPLVRLQRDSITGQMTNVPYALVERTYIPTRECCAFAVLICLGTCE